jgi:hypothetical protein
LSPYIRIRVRIFGISISQQKQERFLLVVSIAFIFSSGLFLLPEREMEVGRPDIALGEKTNTHKKNMSTFPASADDNFESDKKKIVSCRCEEARTKYMMTQISYKKKKMEGRR